MKRFFGGFIGNLCLVIILLFTACGNGKQPITQDTAQEASLAVCTESVDKSYVMEYKDAQVTPDFKPLSNSFCVSGEKLYFVDNQGMTLQSICETDLSGTEKPTKLSVDLSEVFVEALTVETDNSGDATIYCMGRTVAENSFFGGVFRGRRVAFQEGLRRELK